MDKELIQERIDTIKKEMEVTKSNFAKLEGHLGEATHWMATIEKSERDAAELVNELVEKQETADNEIDKE